MGREHLDSRLEGIQNLLSHLNGEVTVLEASYTQVLSVLKRLEGVVGLDDLTGLMRRNAFFAKWETLMQECQRLNDGCGVLLIDIDHFKRVNDTHGHAAGDEVIQRVADLLKRYESPQCAVGRLGGEEFAVALQGTEAEILVTAEAIRMEAEGRTGPVPCTISVGMSAAALSGYSKEAQLQAADEALYDAKRSGRNQVKAAVGIKGWVKAA